MGKLSVRQLFTIVSLTALMVPFQNCSQGVEFSALPDQGSLDAGLGPIVDIRDGSSLKVTDRFSEKVTKTEGQVDLIWMVDNSGSMNAEAEIVRDNLYAFLDFVENKSDIKFKLISRTGVTGTSVSIPFSTSERFSQIDYAVGSLNSISILTTIMNNGQLDNFFRPGALKYVVFVTDDNSKHPATDLQNLFSVNLPGEALKVSGFIGLGGVASPCQYNTGNVYKTLADSSGGHMFNICNQDWSANFEKLASHIVDSANNKFRLTYSNVKSVDKVTVNGNEIDISAVELTGDSIIINTDIKTYAIGDDLDIEIKYTLHTQSKLAAR